MQERFLGIDDAHAGSLPPPECLSRTGQCADIAIGQLGQRGIPERVLLAFSGRFACSVIERQCHGANDVMLWSSGNGCAGLQWKGCFAQVEVLMLRPTAGLPSQAGMNG